jgi:hypothetical protein
MELREKREYLEEATTHRDVGSVLMTVGGILLLFDLSLLLFVGDDIRHGSHFFSRWMAIQAGLGVLFILIGWWKKSRSHEKDDA